MNELLYQFDLDKKYIEEYPLETTEGTKKMIKTYHINAINSRNAYVNNKIEMYEEIKQDILNHIKGRVETLTPQDTVGISNVVIESTVQIDFALGQALVIYQEK